MRKLRAIAATTLALATVGMLAFAASAAQGKTRCGTFRTDGSTLDVTVLRGHVLCSRARHVLNDFFHGKGKMHGPPNGPAYKQYWTVDGWTCGYGAGGGACIRGGKTYKTARYWIEAAV